MSFVGFKRPRIKNDGHLDFIRSLPCACCFSNIESQAAHIRTGSPFHGKRETGGSEKPTDIWVLPLCQRHHDQQHNMNEVEFWKLYGIDPFVLALSLYACTGDVMTADSVLARQAGR
ncbi:MAG: hypothetical protein V4602_15065 [Pseudomonadota bacterium]